MHVYMPPDMYMPWYGCIFLQAVTTASCCMDRGTSDGLAL